MVKKKENKIDWKEEIIEGHRMPAKAFDYMPSDFIYIQCLHIR